MNHCMHGKDVVIEHVSDWRPFSYLTLRYEVGEIEDWAWMYELEQLEQGTRLTVRLADPGGDNWPEIEQEIIDRVNDQAKQLEMLLNDV